jgi:hypothetical protein
VDSIELRNYLGDAIDGVLPESIKFDFENALNQHPAIRTEFELEKLTKRIVHKYCDHVPAPKEVHIDVVATIRNEALQPQISGNWLSKLFGGKAYMPAIALGIALVALLFYLLTPEVKRPLSVVPPPPLNDIVQQSFENYNLLTEGKLLPAVKSTNKADIVSFFKQKGIQYPVTVFPMKGSEWTGAFYSEYSGTKLAHIVYKFKNYLIYTYIADKKDCSGNGKLSIPVKAVTSLTSGELYSDMNSQGYVCLLQEVNSTYCTAVSTLKKEELISLLQKK